VTGRQSSKWSGSSKRMITRARRPRSLRLASCRVFARTVTGAVRGAVGRFEVITQDDEAKREDRGNRPRNFRSPSLGWPAPYAGVRPTLWRPNSYRHLVLTPPLLDSARSGCWLLQRAGWTARAEPAIRSPSLRDMEKTSETGTMPASLWRPMAVIPAEAGTRIRSRPACPRAGTA
jgi:hypothetical protein